MAVAVNACERLDPVADLIFSLPDLLAGRGRHVFRRIRSLHAIAARRPTVIGLTSSRPATNPPMCAM